MRPPIENVTSYSWSGLISEEYPQSRITNKERFSVFRIFRGFPDFAAKNHYHFQIQSNFSIILEQNLEIRVCPVVGIFTILGYGMSHKTL